MKYYIKVKSSNFKTALSKLRREFNAGAKRGGVRNIKSWLDFRAELRHYRLSSLSQPTHRIEQDSKSHGETSTSELENKTKDTMTFEPETKLSI